jgi:hypothetical protein
MRGAMANEISAAMMNHELVTSTSMPAIEPIRMAPGARCWPALAGFSAPEGGVGVTT